MRHLRDTARTALCGTEPTGGAKQYRGSSGKTVRDFPNSVRPSVTGLSAPSCFNDQIAALSLWG